MNRSVTYILLLLVVFLSSCGARKTLESNYRMSGGDSYIQTVIDNNKDFEYFYSKVRVSVSLDGKSISANANLKIKNNSLILYSITMPLLGIEVLRVEIDDTDVLLVDKFNKRYVRIPLSQSEKYLGWKVGYSDMQALFMDDIFCLSNGSNRLLPKLFLLEQSENGTLIRARNEEPVMNFSIDDGLRLVKSTELSSTGKGSLHWNYRDFEKVGGMYYPSEMDVTVSNMSHRINMNMKCTKMSFDKSSMSRIDLSRYKSISLDEGIKSLSKYLDF